MKFCERVQVIVLTYMWLNLQTTGLGGEVQKGRDSSKIETMNPVKERLIRVRFNADTASSMQWNFRPQQTEIQVDSHQILYGCFLLSWW